MTFRLLITALPAILWLFSINAIASANTQKYEYIEISASRSFSSNSLCPQVDFSVSYNNEIITIKSRSGALNIKDELEDNTPELIAGDFWGNGLCFIAIMNARNDVNESYDLYEIKATAPPRKITSIPSLVNPDFTADIVTSSYRDAARWHKENICLDRLSPYICAKSESINDDLEFTKNCSPNGNCEPVRLVLTSSELTPAAVVIENKVFIYKPDATGKISAQRSYLIKDDKLRLVDYKIYAGKSYYKFEYKGKNLTTGWIPTSAVKISIHN